MCVCVCLFVCVCVCVRRWLSARGVSRSLKHLNRLVAQWEGERE